MRSLCSEMVFMLHYSTHSLHVFSIKSTKWTNSNVNSIPVEATLHRLSLLVTQAGSEFNGTSRWPFTSWYWNHHTSSYLNWQHSFALRGTLDAC
jgi:hypothetical protein